MPKLPRKNMTRAIFILIGILLLFPSAKIFSLHSNFFDLGIFQSAFYRISKNNEWQLAFAGHAHWFELLYAFFYGLMPLSLGPYVIVSIQLVLLFLPAFWFFHRFGLFATFVYVAYYPVWAIAFFDFHFDHLAVPILLCFYWALIDRKIFWAVLSATLLIFIKEPFALEVVGCGFLLLLGTFHHRSIWDKPLDSVSRRNMLIGGVWLIVLGLGYFYFAIHYLLPFFTPENWGNIIESKAFSWLGRSLAEISLNIMTAPHLIILDIINTQGKLIYLFVVFGLIGFISLLRPAFLIPAIPVLAISMLSHLPNYYDYNTHYTAGLIIPVMIAFVHGLPQAEKLWIRSATLIGCLLRNIFKPFFLAVATCTYLEGMRTLAVYGYLKKCFFEIRYFFISIHIKGKNQFYLLLSAFILCGHIAISPSPISRLFWMDKVWSMNWHAYVPTERESMMKSMMDKYIPADPGISVTTQNTVNWNHLANRHTYLPFPMGVAEPYEIAEWPSFTWRGFWLFIETGVKPKAIYRARYADYVVLDLKRPYFLMDQGCEWIYGKCKDEEKEKKFLEWVHYTFLIYDTVFEQDGFMILRRKA